MKKAVVFTLLMLALGQTAFSQQKMATALLSTRDYLRFIDSRSVKAIEISPKVQLK